MATPIRKLPERKQIPPPVSVVPLDYSKIREMARRIHLEREQKKQVEIPVTHSDLYEHEKRMFLNS